MTPIRCVRVVDRDAVSVLISVDAADAMVSLTARELTVTLSAREAVALGCDLVEAAEVPAPADPWAEVTR